MSGFAKRTGDFWGHNMIFWFCELLAYFSQFWLFHKAFFCVFFGTTPSSGTYCRWFWRKSKQCSFKEGLSEHLRPKDEAKGVKHVCFWKVEKDVELPVGTFHGYVLQASCHLGEDKLSNRRRHFCYGFEKHQADIPSHAPLQKHPKERHENKCR